MKRKAVLTVAVIAGLAAVPLWGAACSASANQPDATPTPPSKIGPNQWAGAPPMMIDVNKEYTAVIETNYGKINVRFFPKEAPLTVNNFVFLAREGYYNNIKVHRIVKGFVIQTGDATRGDGTGGPGYRFPDEPIVRDYKPGTLAMANSGPNTNGSQFFICLEDLTTRLAKSYTIFGEVTGGFDVVLAIGNLPVSGQSPTIDVRVLSVTIQEK